MSDCKTVTHEGKVYEIGKDYLFKNAGNAWFYAALDDVISKTANPFKTKYQNFISIKEVPASKFLGAITPAPIELIDGNAYAFTYYRVTACIQGIYEESSDKFYVKGGWFMSKSCTNIRPMTVEKK